MRIVLVMLTGLLLTVNCEAVVKVACLGASITYGATIENREQSSYPAQLQKLLGDGYQVSNYGVSSCTMLRKGNVSYWNTPEYKKALQSNPDVVFIDLGGNDSKLINRVYLDEYEKDCRDLIHSFTDQQQHPRVILMLPIVSFVEDTTGIWDPVISGRIIPRIRQVAWEENVEVIDMHSLLINHPELMPDKIHPNAEGSAIMAKRLCEQLIQKKDVKFDIFHKIKSDNKPAPFYGYACIDFEIKGHACKVVKPKWSATGHPWIWRARFWGHEPQTDIALLERGYHLVYCDVAELFGNDKAITVWNSFYKLLRSAGLSKKAVMEGMSRGGVYVFNWAAENPGRVSCVYVDNPVLDLKSWPAGLGKVARSENEFRQFLTDYNLKNEEQVRQFNGSPVDKIEQIVKGNYPILILSADDDEAVSPAENALLFERKIRSANGNITVIHKPGFRHHPHSLPNPAPIVDFILSSVKKDN